MKTNPTLLAGIKMHVAESDDFRFRNTQKMYRYWAEKRGERPRPRWRDITLMDIYDVAPCICVRDVIPGENDFVCRYWGTRLTDLYGIDCSGKKVSECYSPSGIRNTLGIYSRVISSERPVRLIGNLGYVDRSERTFFEGVFLRLDGDDAPDRHVIAALQIGCQLDADDLENLEKPAAD